MTDSEPGKRLGRGESIRKLLAAGVKVGAVVSSVLSIKQSTESTNMLRGGVRLHKKMF